MSRLPLWSCAVLALGVAIGIVARGPRGELPHIEDPTERALNEKLAQNAAEVQYKQYLVTELAAGRMTLTEVADEFLRVNEEQPAIMESIRVQYAGADDREKSARNVLGFARSRCGIEDYERLNTEFARLFGRPADVT